MLPSFCKGWVSTWCFGLCLAHSFILSYLQPFALYIFFNSLILYHCCLKQVIQIKIIIIYNHPTEKRIFLHVAFTLLLPYMFLPLTQSQKYLPKTKFLLFMCECMIYYSYRKLCVIVADLKNSICSHLLVDNVRSIYNTHGKEDRQLEGKRRPRMWILILWPSFHVTNLAIIFHQITLREIFSNTKILHLEA